MARKSKLSDHTHIGTSMVAPYILSTNSTANNSSDSITSHIFEYEKHWVPLFVTVPVVAWSLVVPLFVTVPVVAWSLVVGSV